MANYNNLESLRGNVFYQYQSSVLFLGLNLAMVQILAQIYHHELNFPNHPFIEPPFPSSSTECKSRPRPEHLSRK